MPAHSKSDSFFRLASPMSVILNLIETGIYNDPGAVSDLYDDGPTCDYMMNIITHWSIATGRDMKASKTTISPRV